MDGSIGHQPVHYVAVGERTLARGWIEFHMRDKSEQPTYEARVFTSRDDKAHDFIAHWLDQFGAPGARVVPGFGRASARLVP